MGCALGFQSLGFKGVEMHRGSIKTGGGGGGLHPKSQGLSPNLYRHCSQSAARKQPPALSPPASTSSPSILNWEVLSASESLKCGMAPK